jgi:hypothetical protein
LCSFWYFSAFWYLVPRKSGNPDRRLSGLPILASPSRVLFAFLFFVKNTAPVICYTDTNFSFFAKQAVRRKIALAKLWRIFFLFFQFFGGKIIHNLSGKIQHSYLIQ